MAAKLYDIVKWVEKNGEVKALDRLRVSLLPELLDEGVRLADVSPGTDCSPSLLSRVKVEAGTIVGQPYPD